MNKSFKKNPVQLLLLLLMSTIWVQCSDDPTTKVITRTSKSPSDHNTSLLIFKKEQSLEIWQSGKKSSQIEIEFDANIPIGIFKGQISNTGCKLIFPNEFYRSKNYHLDFSPELSSSSSQLKTIDWEHTSIYIFPNDSRNGKNFVADFSSPHWKSEIYAKMELHLKEFN